MICRFAILYLLALILNSARADDLSYPLAGNIRPEAVTFELWFRLDKEPENNGSMQFWMGLIHWKDTKLPTFTRLGYHTIWLTNEYHLSVRMGGFSMGYPTDGLPFSSVEKTFKSAELPRDYPRHDRLHRGEWHYVAWTCKRSSQPDLTCYLDGKVVVPTKQVLLDPWHDLENATLEFQNSPLTLDELRISDVVRTPEQIAKTFARGALQKDEHTLLLDHFDRVENRQTLAEVISGFRGEKGGTIHGKESDMVDGKFGKALRLISLPAGP